MRLGLSDGWVTRPRGRCEKGGRPWQLRLPRFKGGLAPNVNTIFLLIIYLALQREKLSTMEKGFERAIFLKDDRGIERVSQGGARNSL